ncbi:ribosome biogenesis GTPase A [Gottschalkia acidurici 9a]|uniref:Ribosome biogenesis GTPase A n=1 Tax=Gottschalkia acidurici (strain ATCC 7906 / DSM 604 / BCRC 14475 / CIP 104303 / KCTC 5404 / NCIMB 10678 / 9a) TaxID=1128398 RepID=K0B1P9_GOTA9|nr:ribosome biogenesis GTPase YlqF [Gottschalkia acidurici]AFS78626.1 ribosome biogenesis GTPase A [Gottschalkia acidurici 9a]
MNINWYPGHMKKTKELLQANLKLVDIVIELLDARIPISSKNPMIDEIISNKPRLVIMNKSDLSSEKGNKLWKEYFESKNIPVVFITATNNNGIDKVTNEVQKVLKDKMQKRKEKGIKSTSVRAMIVGIPNVGKSTLINSLAGRKGAKTGNRPGITTSKQWIKLKGDIELLDTPGILWPKFEDKRVALNLAFTGAIKDEILDTETLALKLVEKLCAIDTSLIEGRYDVQVNDSTPLEVMEEIAEKRGCIIKGGEIDYTRVSGILLDEFRRGIMGKVTLDFPE